MCHCNTQSRAAVDGWEANSKNKPGSGPPQILLPPMMPAAGKCIVYPEPLLLKTLRDSLPKNER